MATTVRPVARSRTRKARFTRSTCVARPTSFLRLSSETDELDPLPDAQTIKDDPEPAKGQTSKLTSSSTSSSSSIASIPPPERRKPYPRNDGTDDRGGTAGAKQADTGLQDEREAANAGFDEGAVKVKAEPTD